jgi:hypothetical protein
MGKHAAWQVLLWVVHHGETVASVARQDRDGHKEPVLLNENLTVPSADLSNLPLPFVLAGLVRARSGDSTSRALIFKGL